MKAVGEPSKAMKTGFGLSKNNWLISRSIPNLPHASVPTGQDAADNVEVRRWGSPPPCSAPAQSHWDLGESLGILDFDRAVRMAKARFAVLTGLGAVRAGAHQLYAWTCIPPARLSRSAASVDGQSRGDDRDRSTTQIRRRPVPDARRRTVPNPHRRSSVTQSAPRRDISGRDLADSIHGLRALFRREAGSYGKDTRGLIRLHQFNKVELVAFHAKA